MSRKLFVLAIGVLVGLQVLFYKILKENALG